MLGAVETGGKGSFPQKRAVSLAPISYPVNVSKPDGSMVGIPDMLFPELRVRKRRSRTLSEITSHNGTSGRE
jgi:hypothetical protein